MLATGTVTREWMVPGETARVLTLKNDKVAGVLFTPPPGTPRHPGVLPFGGAEGGMSQVYAAALLAAHGYPALTVAYFDWPGLPGHLVRIPLEYFETAGRIVAAQSGTDPAQNDPSQPAWALNGKGIAPGPIPEYDISGPVLALAAGDDALVTDAGESADEVAFDMESEGGKRYPGQALVYPDAGPNRAGGGGGAGSSPSG